MTTSSKTAADIINASFDILGITAENEPVSSAQQATALITLNDLLQSFVMEGIQMPYANMAATDTMTIPASQFRAVQYLLAYELAPKFGTDITPQVQGLCMRAMTELQAYYAQIETLDVDTGLRYTPTRYWGTGSVRY